MWLHTCADSSSVRLVVVLVVVMCMILVRIEGPIAAPYFQPDGEYSLEAPLEPAWLESQVCTRWWLKVCEKELEPEAE